MARACNTSIRRRISGSASSAALKLFFKQAEERDRHAMKFVQ
jgi:hypothetical protein